MSSANTRSQIVLDALSLAGRSTELKAAATQWLNYGLRDLGLTFRFPELRKTGTPQTLAIGQSTVSLPADFGAGMEKSGMIFGQDNKPLEEVSFEEFAVNLGFPIPNTVGRPYRYLVDLESKTFRFERAADQAYSFTPTYFKTPPILPVDPAYDNEPIWLDNDAIAVHMLVWWIYVFTEDSREMVQEARVEKMVNKWKRETTKMGGTSRVFPSPSRFKNMTYKGFGGFNGP